jgi:hypothetical protein
VVRPTVARSQIPARVNEHRLINPARVLRAGAWAIAAAYGGCWAAGLIPWWLVLGYSLVLTVALAETDVR